MSVLSQMEFDEIFLHLTTWFYFILQKINFLNRRLYSVNMWSSGRDQQPATGGSHAATQRNSLAPQRALPNFHSHTTADPHKGPAVHPNFQTLSGYRWNQQTLDVLQKVVGSNNLWSNYCIARAAIRYGHHKVSLIR